MRYRFPRAALTIVCCGALTAAASAQREKATLEFQKRATMITYGAVRVGNHSLDSLQVGSSWRLGNNEASTWRLDMPILVDGKVLPPGDYRVNLFRESTDRLGIDLVGSHLALGIERDARLPGTLAESKKPNEQLAIAMATAGKPVKGAAHQDAKVIVAFGKSEWTGEMRILGGELSSKLGKGWLLDIFAVPGDLVVARAATPLVIGTLRKKSSDSKAPLGWNLILAGDEARLVPWMHAPTEQFGFAEPAAPDANWIRRGSIEQPEVESKGESTTAEEVPPLRLRSAASKKDVFEIDVAAGDHSILVKIAPPAAPKKSQ